MGALSIPMFLNENEMKFNSLDCKFDRSEIYLVQIFKRLGTGLLYNWLVLRRRRRRRRNRKKKRKEMRNRQSKLEKLDVDEEVSSRFKIHAYATKFDRRSRSVAARCTRFF